MKLVYELKHGFISVTLSYIFSFFLSYIDLYPYISVLLAQKTINNFVLRSSYFPFLFVFWVSGLVAHAQLPIKRDKLQSCHDGVKLVEGRLRGLLLLIFSWVRAKQIFLHKNKINHGYFLCTIFSTKKMCDFTWNT